MDAADWDARYAAQELVWSKGPNAFVVDRLAGLTPGRALDLAGGEGRNAIWLAQRGWDVELVEFSQVALDKAATLTEHADPAPTGTVTRTLADVTAAPALEEADLVLLAYLQLPSEASHRAVRFAASLVAPGGTLLLVAHAKRNVIDGVGGPPDPEVNRSPEELRAALDGTGLTLLEVGEVTRSVATDDGEREAIDVLVRAERPLAPAAEPGSG